MRIAIGYDPNASRHAQVAKGVCEKLGIEVVQMLGDEEPIYANTAIQIAHDVAQGRIDRGILICGTGIGMSISANKVTGAYAALISDVYSAVRASKSNMANIGCFGAFTLGEKLMAELMEAWLLSEYEEGTPSAPKVQRIRDYERERLAEGNGCA